MFWENVTTLIIITIFYVATVLRHCASRVLALCSTVAATMLWFRESFFSPHLFKPFVYSTSTVATVPKVFFFFLLNIDVSWHLYCYIDTTNFTIFSQLLTCQFLTSRNKNNKIWDCSQLQLKINVFKKMLQHLLLSQYLHNCWNLNFLYIK